MKRLSGTNFSSENNWWQLEHSVETSANYFLSSSWYQITFSSMISEFGVGMREKSSSLVCTGLISLRKLPVQSYPIPHHLLDAWTWLTCNRIWGSCSSWGEMGSSLALWRPEEKIVYCMSCWSHTQAVFFCYFFFLFFIWSGYEAGKLLAGVVHW